MAQTHKRAYIRGSEQIDRAAVPIGSDGAGWVTRFTLGPGRLEN